MKDTVSDWRSEIDAIDAELLGLLNRRAGVALRVGDAKRRDASPLYDPHRECEVIANVCRRNAGPLDDDAVANVFQRVIDECRRVQRRAAEIYGGVVLQEHLEDHREDYTRFVLLAAGTEPAREGNKLSLAVRLTNRPGAIRDAVESLARHDVDLLSVESRPFKGRPWQYHFLLDLRAPEDEAALTQALDELGRRAEEVRVLGRYTSAGETL